MAEIKVEDIAGIYDEGKLYCIDCWNKEMSDETYELDDVLTHEDVENDDEKQYFCDNCKRRIG